MNADIKRAAMQTHVAMGFGLDCADSQALLDEIERLAAEKETFSKAYAHVDECLNKVKEHRDILRKALHPFAHQAKIIDGNDASDGDGPEPDYLAFRFRTSYTAISIGDCRRADEAMLATDPPT